MMSTPLRHLLTSVLFDDDTRAHAAADPQAFLAEHGWDGLDAPELAEAMHVVGDALPVPAALALGDATDLMALDPDLDAAAGLGTVAGAIDAEVMIDLSLDPAHLREPDAVDIAGTASTDIDGHPTTDHDADPDPVHEPAPHDHIDEDGTDTGDHFDDLHEDLDTDSDSDGAQVGSASPAVDRPAEAARRDTAPPVRDGVEPDVDLDHRTVDLVPDDVDLDDDRLDERYATTTVDPTSPVDDLDDLDTDSPTLLHDGDVDFGIDLGLADDPAHLDTDDGFGSGHHDVAPTDPHGIDLEDHASMPDLHDLDSSDPSLGDLDPHGTAHLDDGAVEHLDTAHHVFDHDVDDLAHHLDDPDPSGLALSPEHHLDHHPVDPHHVDPHHHDLDIDP